MILLYYSLILLNILHVIKLDVIVWVILTERIDHILAILLLDALLCIGTDGVTHRAECLTQSTERHTEGIPCGNCDLFAVLEVFELIYGVMIPLLPLVSIF